MVHETKQVRVDNWGTYFLQRLQLFFSKTDYCDLTLQFQGNVQLKVHRLVMNACTEYFLYLEQTCPALEENTIMMPDNLQADVIVPIVNFMYTGMLEFHPSIFHKLYKAAEIMSISVLTKLLEAQMESAMNSLSNKKKSNKTNVKNELFNHDSHKSIIENEPTSYSRSAVPKRVTAVASPKASPLPPREDAPVPVALATASRPRANWRRRQVSHAATALPHPSSATFSEVKWQPVQSKDDKHVTVLHDSTPRPTRFEWPDDELPASMSMLDNSFDENISLTSKPLVTKREEDDRAGPSFFGESRSSALSYRSANSRQNSFSTEPDEYITGDTKEHFAHEEHEEKPNILENSGAKRKFESVVKMISPKRPKLAEKENESQMSEHTISIKAPKSSGELDHTKIVQEILKKYPGLVKKNKNIKLKIMTKPDPDGNMVNHRIKMQISNSPEPVEKEERPRTFSKAQPIRMSEEDKKFETSASKIKAARTKTKRASPDGPWTCLECDDTPEFVLFYLFRKHLSDVHNEVFDASCCKYCDRRCSSEVTMAYHLHIKHNLKPPAKMNFPKCPKCSFVGITSEKLKDHLAKHNADSVQCPQCKLGFENIQYLSNHLVVANHHNSKASESKLTCPYCTTKKLVTPVSLFNHIKAIHIKEAQRDKIVSLTDDMDFEDPEDEIFENEPVEGEDEEEVESEHQTDKVKIISDVKVASKPQSEATEAEEEQDDDPAVHVDNSKTTKPATINPQSLKNVNVPSTIANNLGLVDIVVLDDNRQYILQQEEEHQSEAGAEFILPQDLNNEALLQAATNELNSTDELVMVLTDQDYHQDGQNSGQSDNSNIVVLYSHPVEGREGQYITSQGNIMVNSQTGMLEIRNGAAIATTDGDIIVNQQISTENQGESIELIQKEIHENSKSKTDNKHKIVNQDPTINKEISVPNDKEEEINSEVVQKDTDLNKKTDNIREDVTDSLEQAEPMEVDEDGASLQPIQEASNEEEHIPEGSNQKIEDKPTTEKIPEENPGCDVPPDLSNSQHEPNQDEPNKSAEEILILNDVTETNADVTGASEHQDEPMEVDGAVQTAKEDIQESEEQSKTPNEHERMSENPVDSLAVTESTVGLSEEQGKTANNEPDKEEDSDKPSLIFREEDNESHRQIRSRDEVQREINKSILEDWSEDTDSQQSEKQDVSTDSTDIADVVTEAGTDKQTSNVSKLMDDWEEEEDEGN